ncbi:S8 family peptidase [Micromonospora eburnea]|uniref:Serine protease, subtilisin family n=1 Tax=Micromonospora eburnea TaxID=227316 RepID=A0A1C6TUU2_9ACTN|nr:S8 family serine peptidase [Micromonospora eburnea]SCL45554.1 Serine protease, subtilisin family [Micromonospora eburnea]
MFSRRLGVIAGAVALSLGIDGGGAVARPPTQPPTRQQAGTDQGGGPVLPVGRTYTLTLLTGDVVTVSGRGSACPAVTVRPAKPHGVQHRGCGPDGHLRVVPAEVAGLLGSVLDESLFDVTALIMNGYDDARSQDLPLIVRPGDAGAGTLAADPLTTGLGRRRALPSIGAVAGRQSKRSGAAFIRTLTSRTAGRPAARAAQAGPKVWLDRRVRATAAPAPTRREQTTGGLDRNLTQIAAPTAWRSGVTGAGTRVAVLDTGADFTHPDLVGQVVERADFSTPDGDAVDRMGHGTHVAATIAGTGAAAGGERRGVAPGAKLLVGKVLDDDGFGTESQVIAGMEWAAARADVVNLSLGGDAPSDGSDPMSLTVDELTRQHGTLFVVAAGNDGPTDGWIAAPAAASTALTVGAVDPNDALADFSSRGPLVNTRAAKPELVAPGVGIVAARATGTLMGNALDARYTMASGTSMATPHVAGAAALLAQRHPDWRPDQLKAALVGAADPLAGADSYAVGAGRLNAARALTGVVAGQDLINLGTFDYPQSGTASTALAWRNTESRALRLDLGLTIRHRDGTTAPAAAGALSANQVAVSPRGTARVTLRIDRARFAAKPGLYTAVVTARAAGGFVAVTPVTFYVEPRSYDLTLSATRLPNAAAGVDQFGGVRVVNLDDPTIFAEFANVAPGEPETVRVPAGRYTVAGYQMETDWDTWASRMALVGAPEVLVDRDTALVADAGRAEQLRVSVDGVSTEASQAGITYQQYAPNGTLVSEDFAYAWGDEARDWGVYAVPMAEPTVGRFEAYTTFSLRAPGEQPSPFVYEVIRALPNGIPANLTHRVTASELATYARIDQRFHRLDKPGSTTGHKRYAWTAAGLNLLDAYTENVPTNRVDYLSPGFFYDDEAFFSGPNSDYEAVTQEAHRQYAPGSRHTKTWVRQPLRPDWYDDPATSYSDCMPQPIRRTRGNLHVDLVELADEHQRFDCLGWDEFEEVAKRKLTLHRDGRLVGEYAGSSGDFTIPQQAGDYRLSYDLDMGGLLPVSTRVSTAWTFRSTGPSDHRSVPVPLLSVDYALPLDAANHPTGGTAGFTVHQSHGVAKQRVTGFELWTSTDDGGTWQPVTVRAGGDGGFTAALPTPGDGQAVSLRVKVTADGGSGIDQTIIRAYRAG